MTGRLALLCLVAAVATAATLGATAVTPARSLAPAADAGPPRALEGVGQANGTELVSDGDELTLAAGPGRAVEGRTDLSPGTVLTVRVQSTDDDHPYLRSATARVGDGGAFRAVFDLSPLPAGTPLRVVVHDEGATLTAATGATVPCSACPHATPVTPSAVVTHDGAAITFDDAPGQVVRGHTNLPPGTELMVRLRSAAGAAPFIKSTRTTVDANGTFRAVFDLAAVPQGTEVGVGVRYNGSELSSASGRVACRGACGGTPTGSGSFEDAEIGVVQVANGSVARVRVRLGGPETATLSVGSPGASYAVNATLRDGDGDGEVVVVFDTAAGDLAAAGDADAVAVHDRRGTVAAADYRLALHPPGDGTTAVATGLLVVTQDGSSGTPLLTASPGATTGVAVGSAVALAAGAVLGVLGLGLLLGLVDLDALVGRR